MAATDTYILKSAVFTPTGGSPAAVTFTGLERISFGESGEAVAHGSDGQIAVTAHFIDRIAGQVTITSTNLGKAADAALAIGIAGALVLVFQLRKLGKGAVSGSDKTLTFGQAVVQDKSGDGPDTARSELTVQFACSDPSGLAPGVWS